MTTVIQDTISLVYSLEEHLNGHKLGRESIYLIITLSMLFREVSHVLQALRVVYFIVYDEERLAILLPIGLPLWVSAWPEISLLRWCWLICGLLLLATGFTLDWWNLIVLNSFSCFNLQTLWVSSIDHKLTLKSTWITLKDNSILQNAWYVIISCYISSLTNVFSCIVPFTCIRHFIIILTMASWLFPLKILSTQFGILSVLAFLPIQSFQSVSWHSALFRFT